jgi:hypothetical protein
LEVTQVGLLEVNQNGAEPPLADSFPAEHVHFFPAGR